MNRFVEQLISYFLLLCISVTVVPFSLFHHHNDEEIHCDVSDVKHEDDPCHISIYHTHQVEKNQCKHESHINDTHDQCRFCEFITSQRYKYFVNEKHSSVSKSHSKSLLTYGYSYSLKLFINVVYNRGPPA